MKRPSVRRAGFTIIETMIFLIITGAMVTVALALFGNRIAQTRFNQAVDELNTRITGTINEVAAGTYPAVPAFSCSVVSGVPTTTPATGQEQGSNSNCVFLGKVMQFGTAGTNCSTTVTSACNTMTVYSMVGRRSSNTGTEATVFSSGGANSVNPRLVNNTSPYSTGVDLTQIYPLGGGMTVTAVRNRATDTSVTGVGVTQSLGTYTASGGSTTRLNSGAQRLILWGLANPAAPEWPRTRAQISSMVGTTSSGGNPFAVANQDPPEGIVVCLEGGINQKASITIGDNDGRIATTVLKAQDPECP